MECRRKTSKERLQKAQNGDDKEQYDLGLHYECCEPKYEEAIRWYTQSAQKNNMYAQYRLAKLYYKGKGCKKNFEIAAKWFLSAAQSGHASAQYKLGNMYKHGEGLLRDEKKSLEWWHKAADQSHAHAQYDIGIYYRIRKEKEQVAWFRKAADHGYAQAQYLLGLCEEDGVDGEKNIEEALKWYEKAMAQGHKDAKKNFDDLKNKKKRISMIMMVTYIAECICGRNATISDLKKAQESITSIVRECVKNGMIHNSKDNDTVKYSVHEILSNSFKNLSVKEFDDTTHMIMQHSNVPASLLAVTKKKTSQKDDNKKLEKKEEKDESQKKRKTQQKKVVPYYETDYSEILKSDAIDRIFKRHCDLQMDPDYVKVAIDCLHLVHRDTPKYRNICIQRLCFVVFCCY